MNSKILFGLCLVVFFVVAEVSGRSCCVCNRGVDYCGCQATPYEYRPVDLKPTKLKNIRPIGDVCNCRNVHLQPVALPKQKIIWQEKKHDQCDDSPLIPAPDHYHDFTLDEDEVVVHPEYPSPCDPRPLYPVDPVSIDLVNRMQQSAAAAIPEEKLQYGFWKLPRELPNYKVTSNVPEEGLYTFDKQVVELKNPRKLIKCGSGCNEEVILEEREPHPVAYLSYRDLGFVPETANYGQFETSCKYEKPCEENYENMKHYKESSQECNCNIKVCLGDCQCKPKKTKSYCDC